MTAIHPSMSREPEGTVEVDAFLDRLLDDAETSVRDEHEASRARPSSGTPTPDESMPPIPRPNAYD